LRLFDHLSFHDGDGAFEWKDNIMQAVKSVYNNREARP